MSPERILICDINIKKQGHYIGYNQYILDHIQEIENRNPNLHFIFLYNEEAKHLLTIPSGISNRVHYMKADQDKGFLQSNVLVFKKIKKHLSDHAITSMVFMDLDKYQLGIAVTRFNCTISGILFRPHHRITSSNPSVISKGKTYLKRLKKIISEKLLLANKKVTKVFILNDHEGVAALNKSHNTNVFQYLTDPIFQYGKVKDQSLKKGGSSEEVHTFLIFGAINERKNITNIIKAFELAKFQIKSKLLIVGPGKEEYISYLNELVKSLPSLKENVKTIEIKNEFVSNEEMDYYFSISDTCLLIYKNFFGSSGLLGRAALHHLKVIGPNVGLLNEIITSNRLGITCDPENVEDIAASLMEANNYVVSESTFEKFYQQYSPNQFISTLLTSNS